LLAHEEPEFSLIRAERNAKNDFRFTVGIVWFLPFQVSQIRDELARQADVAGHLCKAFRRCVLLIRRKTRSAIKNSWKFGSRRISLFWTVSAHTAGSIRRES